jgi:thymidylate synthase (FAD)
MNHEDKNISIDLYGDGIGKVQLVQSMGSDATIVRAARVSFGKDEKGDELSDKDKKLIRYLIKHKHTSTLEHCNVTFKCVVPLFIRSQHHRHRTWSYNEISRRYTAEKLEFYEPKAFRTQHASNRQASNENELIDPLLEYEQLNKFESFNAIDKKSVASYSIRTHHENSVRLYNELMDKGVCREQARGVLPQNLYTEYYASANLSNILKFIDLRSHEGAQLEIQLVAEAMLQILEELYPETLKAYKEVKG